ncbi:RNA polymerase sigma factor RpoH [Laribacter hongkongensis]|uniref:RNA polymerase sigma factor RpoH n=1 Tax=Laribacter hongkongensis TaxID=168471 RepID=UPI001EFC4A00|nr:RNA polymerase sigma factor RpoH [Laribacter hongkongensis]MCG9033205.1 RNA polymerase sigma factor RpoH [Laribacter hongkongensis]MCG9066307.1 RNA polymerase sigma factor RpoH [Laribacter hongkongensis]MCG9093266.1 RNA polymerase sigma factor RpoH [Laribacter hongkongensis]
MNVTMNLPVPSANGSLDQYIAAVNSIPMLSQDEEQALARRLQQDNDVDAARQLVMSHLRVVVSIARGYAGYGLPQADLIQEGNIGLMKAVKRFEPERGVRLFSFAIHWIKAEIHEFILRNWRLVRVATTKPQRKLFFNLRSMKQGFSALSDTEARQIADDLGVKPEEVREMETRMSGQDISLLAEDNEEEGFAPIDWLADTRSEPTKQLEIQAYERLQREGIEQALQALDPRSRRIIEARWLADDGGLTLHDLAAEFGVSAERIRQIEVKALKKMKLTMIAE